MFAHKGGSKAAESVVIDTFDNNKMMVRAVFFHVMTVFMSTIGVAKQKPYIHIPIYAALLGSALFTYAVVKSAFKLYSLSELVRQNNLEVWENLNEARYVQRSDELFSPTYYVPRYAGMLLIAASSLYLIPLFGTCMILSSLTFGLHKKLN